MESRYVAVVNWRNVSVHINTGFTLEKENFYSDSIVFSLLKYSSQRTPTNKIPSNIALSVA
jgi:hypothetical protein